MKLTDVVNRINGNVDRFTTDLEYYIGGEHFESCELEISKRGLIKPNLNILGFKFHFAFQERDVIFMARNPHLRKAGMVLFAGLCSDASYILRSKDENILTQVAQYGYDVNKCRECVMKNKYDTLTAVYYLLVKKHKLRCLSKRSCL